jgi:hypothetical protein
MDREHYLLSNTGSQLKAQLERNLADVKPIDELGYRPPMDNCKALIGP